MIYLWKNVVPSSRRFSISCVRIFIFWNWVLNASIIPTSLWFQRRILQEYWMISCQYLFWISIKLITKILAERLQQVILRLIHSNKYGFVKSTTIHDYHAWSFEYIHKCHLSKREIIMVKLDFTKAFDIMEHQAILQVMKHMGFPNLWLKWVEQILDAGTSSILLNGVPR